jgi:hypothetical protein
MYLLSERLLLRPLLPSMPRHAALRSAAQLTRTLPQPLPHTKVPTPLALVEPTPETSDQGFQEQAIEM